MSQTLNIGLVAYGIDPSMVMVRVPNERGRWVLTKRCVIEVACPLCLSVVGEPCNSARRRWRDATGPVRYTSGIHVARDHAWAEKEGARFPARRAKPHKLRINAGELAELQTPVVESEPE